MGFLKPRLKLTFGYVQNWHSYLDSATPEVDVSRKLVIYHRWGNDRDGNLERFIIVLNFSASNQIVDIPFPLNGTWKDLLNNDQSYLVSSFRLVTQTIDSNWGRILYIKG
jgi:pullulanase